MNFTINLDGNAYKGILQVNDALDDVLVNAKQVKQSFTDWTKTFMGFDAVTNLIGKASQAFQSMVGSSLDFEQQQANMRTLLNGDAEATDNLIGKIREYGKATVYDLSGLIEAQKTMMAFGLDAEYAFGKLKNIGDIALGDKQKMQSLALAFSQMSSTGKLMGQDLLQMINAGFNPLEVISQKTGKSIAELKEEMGKGAISAEQVAQAFEWATEEGGRFYQGAETAAQTTAGKIAKVKDQIDDLKISLFEWSHGATAWIAEMGNFIVPISQAYPLLQTMAKGVVNAIKWCGTNWSSFVKLVKTGVVNIALNMEILKFSIKSAGGFFPWLRGVAIAACRGIGVAISSIPIVGWIAAAIAAVIGLVALLWKKSEGFRRLVFGVWESIKAVANNVWQVVKTVALVIWEGILSPIYTRIKGMFESIVAFIRIAVERIQAFFVALRNGVVRIVTGIGEFFSMIWGWVSETVGKAVNWMAQKLGGVATWIKTRLVDPIRNAFTGLWDIIRDVFDKMLTKLGKLFAPIRELWNKLFPKNKMKDVKLAYGEGAEKGTQSWKRSKSKGDVDTDRSTEVLGLPMADAGVMPGTGGNGKNSVLDGGNLGKNAGTVAGRAQQIHITFGNMVGTMNFNGGLQENARDVEAQLTELVARVLGMAATAA